MTEQKRSYRNRGFYVRMRLLNKHGKAQEKSCFYKYSKWVLWISLSLYFLTSYLISHGTHYKPIPLTRSHTPVSHVSHPSRALYETANTTSLLQTQALLRNLKIFVYDLPPKYNTDWLSNERCSNHLFASEVAIHRALLTSDVRTFDPYDADFFFVPVYVACNFSTANGFPAIAHARALISSAVQLISSEYPFWNRSKGSDHVFVASHDFGVCFHTLEDAAMKDGIPEFLKTSIILQTFGVRYAHPCQGVEHVTIPPYIPPENFEDALRKVPINFRRDIWVFFRGKMEVHPKNVSGRFYGKRVRTRIWRKFSSDRRFYLHRERFAGYLNEIARSVFCLCPLGWAPWSPRLVESVALGCVPVIIADGIQLPFPSAVRWQDISLTVAEKDVNKLASILEHVTATNLTDIEKNLGDPKTKIALLFNNQVQEGDATWQVLIALSERLHRSHRSARGRGSLQPD